MRTIRWGIIGCGNVTEVKSGPGFQKARNSALVAVMRRNAALAQDYAGRHGVPRWYDDGAALIADPEVDAVYVATPPSSHKGYVLACAAAGKPVYVEKPMALDHGECEEMIAACRAANVPLFVAYYRRALPRFLKVKELIDGGAIGLFRRSGQSLLLEVLGSLLKVALILLQSTLTVEHTRLSELTELLDHLGCDCHGAHPRSARSAHWAILPRRTGANPILNSLILSSPGLGRLGLIFRSGDLPGEEAIPRPRHR